MSRKRAGCGWTCISVGRKRIDLIRNYAGHWITTGEASEWRRCLRCRRPFEPWVEADSAHASEICTTCFYYHTLPTAEEFWQRKTDWHFPYNIGRRGFRCHEILAHIHDAGRFAPWRRMLAMQDAAE